MVSAQLCVVGGGNMGEVLLRGVLRAGILPAAAVTLVEPVEARRKKLAGELGVAAVDHVGRAGGAQRYVLAVKPQDIDIVLPAIRASMGEGALVISIAAAISTEYLHRALGPSARIVRAMPNTPMLVGAGCTGLTAGPGATESDLNFAQRLFSAGGAVHLIDESLMDALTAISGCGPAYFFYIVEALVAAGVAEGLTAQMATDLASEACAGAAALMAASGESPATLRAKVTSPGGVTQAAIEALDHAGVRDAFARAILAAVARNRQLGK